MKPPIEGIKVSFQHLTKFYIKSILSFLNMKFFSLPLFKVGIQFKPFQVHKNLKI